jgi:hypothetical protein
MLKNHVQTSTYLFLQGRDLGSEANNSDAFALSRLVCLWDLICSGILFAPIFWSPKNRPLCRFCIIYTLIFHRNSNTQLIQVNNNIHTAANWWLVGGWDCVVLIFSSSYSTSSSVSESDSLSTFQSSSPSLSSEFYHVKI